MAIKNRVSSRATSCSPDHINFVSKRGRPPPPRPPPPRLLAPGKMWLTGFRRRQRHCALHAAVCNHGRHQRRVHWHLMALGPRIGSRADSPVRVTLVQRAKPSAATATTTAASVGTWRRWTIPLIQIILQQSGGVVRCATASATPRPPPLRPWAPGGQCGHCRI